MKIALDVSSVDGTVKKTISERENRSTETPTEKSKERDRDTGSTEYLSAVDNSQKNKNPKLEKQEKRKSIM